MNSSLRSQPGLPELEPAAIPQETNWGENLWSPESKLADDQVLYLFAMAVVLLNWYRGYSEQQAQLNAKLPASSVYDPAVLSQANVIYVLANQMGISTHVLAAFLQLHLEEITSIIKQGELLGFAEYVNTYRLSHSTSEHADAEAVTYYVWERMGLANSANAMAAWEALWQKIYLMLQTVSQVEEIVPDHLVVERHQRQEARAAIAAAEEALAAKKRTPANKWQSWM